VQDKRAAIEKARSKEMNQQSKLRKLKRKLEAQGKAKPLDIRDNVSCWAYAISYITYLHVVCALSLHERYVVSP